MPNDSLPTGWSWATLAELTANATNGFGKRRSDTGDPCVVLRLADITGGEIDLADPRRINCSIDEIEKYRLETNDIIAIRVNGSSDLVGRMIRSRDYGEPVLFCDHFIRLRFREPEMARFVRYFADTRNVRDFIDQHKVCSAGQNTVSQSALEKLLIPVPPLAEQRRIVAKIEELFSDLDAGIAALERVRANLKRYRASVLKAAVEGKLTEQWRSQHPDTEPASVLLERILTERRRQWETSQLAKMQARGKKYGLDSWKEKYEEPSPPDDLRLDALPKGWCWVTLDQIRQESRPIIYGIIKPGPQVETGVPYVRVTEMKDGRIDVAKLRKTSFQRAAKFARATLAAGDLLISKDGTIGRVAVVPPELEGGNITQHIMRVPVHGLVRRYYAVWAIRSPVCQRWLSGETRGVALQGVNVQDFRRLPLPLPPHEEQDEIVAEVERRLSIVDEIEIQVEVNLRRAARLRQGVLKQAFEGHLVPQDPTDEPAQKLLERIRLSARNSTNRIPRGRPARRTRRGASMPLFGDDGTSQGGAQ